MIRSWVIRAVSEPLDRRRGPSRRSRDSSRRTVWASNGVRLLVGLRTAGHRRHRYRKEEAYTASDGRVAPLLLLEPSPHDGPAPAAGVIAVRADNNLAERNIHIGGGDSDAGVGMIARTFDKVGTGTGPSSREYARRFGDPVPALVTTPGVAPATMASATPDGDIEGSASRCRAAIPATWGVAIEVPLTVLVAVSLVGHAEVIPDPGAKTSRQLP